MENVQYRPPCPTEARTPAIVSGVEQRMKQLWEPTQAIRNGTLYPDLYKPMMEYGMPIDCPQASANQTINFSAWELRLYLNTHPDDGRALELYKRYCAALEGPGYACAFTPDGQCEDGEQRGGERFARDEQRGEAFARDEQRGEAFARDEQRGRGERWRWLDNPWPWERGVCDQTEGDCNVCV